MVSDGFGWPLPAFAQYEGLAVAGGQPPRAQTKPNQTKPNQYEGLAVAGGQPPRAQTKPNQTKLLAPSLCASALRALSLAEAPSATSDSGLSQEGDGF